MPTDDALNKTHATSRAARLSGLDLLVGLWGFAEALVWFVVPDVALLAAGVAHPERPVRRALLCLAGSLLGISAMWWLCRTLSMESLVYSLPWTYPAMGQQVAEMTEQGRLWVALGQPASTIPVKVWVAVLAPNPDWTFWPFLLCVGLARGIRMLAFSYTGSLLGRRFPQLASPWGLALYVLAAGAVLHMLALRFR